MPAISKLSRAEWEEIKEAAISGVPINQIAERYDMETGTIYVRAHREKWPMPARIKGLIAKRAKSGEVPRGLLDNPKDENGNVRDCKKGSELIADSLISNGEKASLIASNLALAALQKAAASPDSLAPLKFISDVKTAMQIPRIAAGMDREGINLAVNVAVGGWQASVNPSAKAARFAESSPSGDEEPEVITD